MKDQLWTAQQKGSHYSVGSIPVELGLEFQPWVKWATGLAVLAILGFGWLFVWSIPNSEYLIKMNSCIHSHEEPVELCQTEVYSGEKNPLIRWYYSK